MNTQLRCAALICHMRHKKKLISVPVCVHVMAEELNILLNQNPEEQM